MTSFVVFTLSRVTTSYRKYFNCSTAPTELFNFQRRNCSTRAAEVFSFVRRIQKRRQKYIDERSAKKGEISYDMFTTKDINGENILIDGSDDISEQVERMVMLKKLCHALSLLSMDEKKLIYALFFAGMTEREYAEKEGVFHNVIHKRKIRILKKMKKILKK